MKLLSHSKIRHATLAVAAFGAVLLAASVAQAFTFENPNATVGDTNALRFGAGDSRLSTGPSNGTTNGAPGRSNFGSGNSGIQFNSQPGFNQRYDSSRMFDSNNILGRDR